MAITTYVMADTKSPTKYGFFFESFVHWPPLAHFMNLPVILFSLQYHPIRDAQLGQTLRPQRTAIPDWQSPDVRALA